MGIYIGNKIKLSIFGQSHSKAIGFVLEGLPSGIKIDLEEIKNSLEKRKPAASFDTQRKEEDEIEILSGVRNGYSCGSPITLIIKNKDIKSDFYEKIRDIPRPGHCDYPAFIKFNKYHDFYGGGEFSGRLTAATVAVSGILIPELKKHNISIAAHIKNIGNVEDESFNPVNPLEQMQSLSKRPFILINKNKSGQMQEEIEKYSKNNDSIGGSIECAITGLPAGSGSTMFDSLESRLSQALFSIPAVKGIDFGNPNCNKMSGSSYNDEFRIENERIFTKTNNCGGIQGGLSNGMPLIFNVKIKPTPSILRTQNSVNLKTGENVRLDLKGRFDACIVPRAVPCIEAAASIIIYDYLERT